MTSHRTLPVHGVMWSGYLALMASGNPVCFGSKPQDLPTWPSGATAVTLDLHVSPAGRFQVEAKIGDSPVRKILTLHPASGVCRLEERCVEELSLAVSDPSQLVDGEGRVHRTGVVEVPVVNLGALGLSKWAWHVGSVGDVPDRGDGTLGYPLFRDAVADLSFKRRTVTFLKPETYVPAKAGLDVPLEVKSGLPIVTFKVDGDREARFSLDWDYPGVLVVYQHAVKKFGWKERRGMSVIRGGGPATFVTLARCRLGIAEIPVPEAEVQRGFAECDGEVGAGFFNMFQGVTLDYTRGTMRLFAKPWLGAAIDYSNGMQVQAVGPGSPAALAGLQPGDAIQSVNGGPMSMEEFQRVIREGSAGDALNLVIRREDRDLTLKVMLAPSFR